MKNAADMTPEDLLDASRFAFKLAAEDGGELSERNAISTNATLLMVGAAILDRLERIILLLDERLPTRTAGLEGTVESHG